MDILLRLLCRAGSAPQFRFDSLLWHGVRGHRWYGLGMDHRHGVHPMRRHGNGYGPPLFPHLIQANTLSQLNFAPVCRRREVFITLVSRLTRVIAIHH